MASNGRWWLESMIGSGFRYHFLASSSTVVIRLDSSHKKEGKLSNEWGQENGMRRPNPIGGQWKVIIVYWLVESAKRFAALRQAMPGLSQKVLTQQPRELAADGIMARQPTGEIPAPVEYAPTDYGWYLLPLLEAVRVWGLAHIEHMTAQAAFD
jgi:DNA-binding HxlR family transcriptional regulator